MDMSADEVVLAARQALAEGQGLDVVLAAVTQASASRLPQIARLRAITGFSLIDTQRVLFSDGSLAHVGQREIDLILNFPRLSGERASTIRGWYVEALIRNEPWLVAVPEPAASATKDDQPSLHYWWGREPGPANTGGRVHDLDFDAFRAEMRAIPTDPPTISVVTDTPHLLTCRFALRPAPDTTA